MTYLCRVNNFAYLLSVKFFRIIHIFLTFNINFFMKKLFSLLLVAVVAFAAQAATMNVYQGGQTSGQVPIYGNYLDTKGTRVQVMYPESALADLIGLPINSVTFSIANSGVPAAVSGAKLKVLVGTTDQTSFPSSNASPISGLTEVAEITMTEGATELPIIFNEPFVYNGGSFVIETEVIEESGWGTVEFFGVSNYGSNNAITYTYSWQTRSFYPTATIDYTPQEYAASVSPAALDFGRLYPEQTAEQTFRIDNKGANAFTPAFSGIQAPFSVTPAPAEIPGGDWVTYTVTFVPDALGEYNQTLAIDCGAAGQFQVALSGAQVEVPAEVVVADGTSTNKMVPVDPENYEHVGGGAFSQMIYPANILTELAGKKITGIKFHTTQAMTLNGGNIQLSLKEVDQNIFGAPEAITGMTVVANGAPVAGETELVFEFTEPYQYNGGNLAVEALVTENGNYSFSDAYLGVDSVGASFAHIYNFGWEEGVVNFLPKATFSYEKGETPEPQGMRGDVNGDEAVTIKDVTLLIDYLLSGDTTGVILENADCNLDEAVTIKDVTVLIDYLLSGNWTE